MLARDDSLFLTAAAAGTAAGAIPGAASAAIRAADALLAALFGPIDGICRPGHDQRQNADNQIIYKIHSFISFR